MKRLFVEIVIIAAVIYLGWNTPFKDWTGAGAHKHDICVRQPSAVKARGTHGALRAVML